jgi:hypothetical protein
MHLKKIKIWKGGRRKAPEAKDYGTPEQQRRRILLAGGNPKPIEDVNGVVTRWVDASEDEKKHDTTLTTTPLDVLLVRGEITQDDHSACLYWLGLRKRVFGKATPEAVDLLATSGGRPDEMEDESLGKAEAKYRSACRVLIRAGESVLTTMENILVHEQWPDWLHERRSAHWQARLTRQGIAALGRWARGR